MLPHPRTVLEAFSDRSSVDGVVGAECEIHRVGHYRPVATCDDASSAIDVPFERLFSGSGGDRGFGNCAQLRPTFLFDSLERGSAQQAQLTMPYSFDDKLVVAVASSALFDLGEADRVFRENGTEVYRQYQRDHEADVLEPGVAFPLVQKLLSLNGRSEAERVVEVILLSRNDPDTGLRVLNSIAAHGLDISRASFVNGSTPFRYLDAFNVALFLSANAKDVREAVMRGAPAGQVLPTTISSFGPGSELRVAFDFDGIIADDASEAVYKADGMAAFHRHETEHGSEPAQPGPLNRFFRELSRLQAMERAKRVEQPAYEPRIRTAIVTARNAPAHKRVVTTLREWGIEVDEVFFLGGIDKAQVLREFRPHIFFDDQLAHVDSVSEVAPSVHVPFGVANAPPMPELIVEALEANAARDSR